MIVKYKTHKEFVIDYDTKKETVKGKIIFIEEDPETVFIVGAKTLIKLNAIEYENFLERFSTLTEIRSVSYTSGIMRYIKAETMRFALVVRSANGKQEVLDAVDKASEDMFYLVKELTPEPAKEDSDGE